MKVDLPNRIISKTDHITLIYKSLLLSYTLSSHKLPMNRVSVFDIDVQ